MRVTATGASGSPQVFDGLGFDPAHPTYLGAALGATPPRHIDALQNQIAITIGSSLNPVTLYQAIFGSIGSPLANGTRTYTLTNGDDGVEPESQDFDSALALFTALEDVAIVAAPGSGVLDASQDIINSLITHVSQQRAYRVAILETPPDQIASDNENVRAQIDTGYAALYVPWVIVPNPLARSGSSIPADIAVPPSGYMAGIYARNDVKHGASKAPANEVVLGASRFERNITFNEQQLLNPLGINCLRYFPNRGYLVWGARTTSSDSEFMYVNVRRYLIYLEHSIDNSTQWAVFENNGPALWSRVKEAIDSFLYNEWKQGNLLGDSAAQAYFVRCDRTTMTQNDLDNGRMICLIGVALLKPAEFVIFRIGQKTSDAQS
jgi:phage tail sheath protein FI